MPHASPFTPGEESFAVMQAVDRLPAGNRLWQCAMAQARLAALKQDNAAEARAVVDGELAIAWHDERMDAYLVQRLKALQQETTGAIWTFYAVNAGRMLALHPNDSHEAGEHMAALAEPFEGQLREYIVGTPLVAAHCQDQRVGEMVHARISRAFDSTRKLLVPLGAFVTVPGW